MKVSNIGFVNDINAEGGNVYGCALQNELGVQKGSTFSAGSVNDSQTLVFTGATVVGSPPDFENLSVVCSASRAATLYGAVHLTIIEVGQFF